MQCSKGLSEVIQRFYSQSSASTLTALHVFDGHIRLKSYDHFITLMAFEAYGNDTMLCQTDLRRAVRNYPKDYISIYSLNHSVLIVT